MRSAVIVFAATAVTIAGCADNAGSDPASDSSFPPPPAQANQYGTLRGVDRDGAGASLRLGSGRAEASVEKVAVTPSSPASAPVQFSSAPLDPAPSMIIRTAHASLEVDSLEQAIADLRSLAMRVGGYVANTAMQGGEEQNREASVEIKIPANRFEDVRNGLAALGDLKGLNETAQDVGEEYVDVAARVANSSRLEDRLVALLATRTGRLEDVLSVERELARVREEIERAEGRLRYLKARVSFSTLTVSLFEPRPVIARGGGRSVIGEAFEQAWRNFVGFIAAIIATLGFLIPLAVMLGLGWVGVNAVRRRLPAPTPPATR
jgi:hypothetical protein